MSAQHLQLSRRSKAHTRSEMHLWIWIRGLFSLVSFFLTLAVSGCSAKSNRGKNRLDFPFSSPSVYNYIQVTQFPELNGIFLFCNLQWISIISACPLSPKIHMSIYNAFWRAVPWICCPLHKELPHYICFEVGLASFIWWSLFFVWEETVNSWSASAVPMKARILWICHQPSKSPFLELKMPSLLIHPFYRNSIPSSHFCVIWTFSSFNILLSEIKASELA